MKQASEGKQSRREFLSSSAGLVAAGALGGFSLPTSALAQATGSPHASRQGSPQRIIIDTDPGVDDAIAILLAVRSPELKVEALTPVAGNVPLRFTLTNALRLLELAGHPEIPVASGAETPLVRNLITAAAVHGENGLGGVELPEPKIKPVKETASELIRRVVRENPGEITIVAIGPLTNVATALIADAGLGEKIKSIVIMGGSLSGGNITPAAEFNFYVDPEAARIVFDSGVPLTMVGLDVTTKALIRHEDIRTLESAGTPICDFAAKLLKATIARWHGEGKDTVALHDPLTVGSMIDPGILKLQDFYVLIETMGEASAGQSLGYSHAPINRSAPLKMSAMAPSDQEFKPNAKVAVAVDPDRFFRMMVQRLVHGG